MNLKYQIIHYPITLNRELPRGLKELVHLELNDIVNEDEISFMLSREELEIICQKLILRFIKNKS